MRIMIAPEELRVNGYEVCFKILVLAAFSEVPAGFPNCVGRGKETRFGQRP